MSDENDAQEIDEDNPRRAAVAEADAAAAEAEGEPAPAADQAVDDAPPADAMAGGAAPPDPKDLPGVSVLVRNISFDARSDDLRDAFSKYGNVLDVYLPKHRDTGRVKGIAFIKFAIQAEADEAVDTATGTDLLGREIRCEIAQDRRKSADEMRDRGGGRDDRRGGYGDRRGGYDDRRGGRDDRRGGYDDRRGGYDDRRGGYDDRRGGYGRRDDRPYARNDRPRGVCYAWKEGRCDRGDSCRFAHSEDADRGGPRGHDDRGDRPRGVCFDWQAGRCDRGESCRFAHEGEQRA